MTRRDWQVKSETIIVGVLWRGFFRKFMTRMSLCGYNISFVEHKGLLQSVFEIEGDKEAIEEVRNKALELQSEDEEEEDTCNCKEDPHYEIKALVVTVIVTLFLIGAFFVGHLIDKREEKNMDLTIYCECCGQEYCEEELWNTDDCLEKDTPTIFECDCYDGESRGKKLESREDSERLEEEKKEIGMKACRACKQTNGGLGEIEGRIKIKIQDGYDAYIDECIFKEIKFLWSNKIRTTSCCCGHGDNFATVVVGEESIPKMIELGYRRSIDALSRDDIFLLRFQSMEKKDILNEIEDFRKIIEDEDYIKN
ncbi:MAG: hypothetical protein GY679_01775 [Mycoplasma sp.]|nr:hypothetical protein [Mycoplasma sp.]